MNNFKKSILFGILLNCITPVQAGVTYNQKYYDFRVGENDITMGYSWLNLENKPNVIRFSIDKIDVAKSYIDFKRPNDNVALSFIYNKLQNDIAAINESQSTYKIKLTRQDGAREFSFIIVGEVDDLLVERLKDTLDKRQEKYLKDYFYEYYYIWNENDKLISIDYARITEAYISKMTNVAKAFQAKNNPNMYDTRSVVNDIIEFYQSIPYDTLLEDRGAGFSTPLRLLHENKGDCDTKLVAIAATLKALYPNMQIIAIVLPKHVLIGMKIPYTREDLKMMHKGEPYVLAETAGPGLLPLGEIAEESAAIMRLGMHSVIEL
jgi:hypothetical protein